MGVSACSCCRPRANSRLLLEIPYKDGAEKWCYAYACPVCDLLHKCPVRSGRGLIGRMTGQQQPEAPDEPDTEHDRIVAWRWLQLTGAGFLPDDVNLMAERADIDLHDALEVISKCGDPELAARILL